MEKTLAILSLILAKRQKENTKRVRLKIMNTQSQKLNSKNNNLVARYTLQIVTSRSRCIKFTDVEFCMYHSVRRKPNVFLVIDIDKSCNSCSRRLDTHGEIARLAVC
jgi:hypothetical protein